jgi:hypothetical protein
MALFRTNRQTPVPNWSQVLRSPSTRAFTMVRHYSEYDAKSITDSARSVLDALGIYNGKAL